jgi:alkanesulfonate monooxygenase SsuD/methylene tetrahydromethanopterin reductase-like flavin-dependent oxidoreductase (luciferase family)
LYQAPQPKEPVPVVIAALHPKMLALCAAETQGTHTYFVPPEHTAKVRAQIGPTPWVCVEQKVILSTDAKAARTAARFFMKTYVPRLPNYTNNLKNLGWNPNQRSHPGSPQGGRHSRLYPAAQDRYGAAARRTCDGSPRAQVI